MKSKTKILTVILICFVLVGAFLYVITRGLKAELLEIQPQTIANSFQEEGEIVPAVEHPVHSFLGGEIVKLEVEEGQRVKEGDLLAVIDSTELQFQLKQMQAELKSLLGEKTNVHQNTLESKIKSQELLVGQAEYDLKTLENDFKRIEKLYSEGAVSTKEFEEAKNITEKAIINLNYQQEVLELLNNSNDPAGGSLQFYAGRAEALQSQIELLKHRIEKSNITSPVDGIVANLSAKKGDLINPGFRMMNIFQDEEYLVEVFTPVESANSIKKGMDVSLIQDGKGEDIIFDGVVEKIAPTAVETISALGLKEQRVKITVKPEIPKKLQLLPGTVLDVEFTADKREDVLVVPRTALFPYEEADALWLVENGRAKVQPVETGFGNDSHVVIEKGLSEGTLIILNPQLTGLKEGKKIK